MIRRFLATTAIAFSLAAFAPGLALAEPDEGGVVAALAGEKLSEDTLLQTLVGREFELLKQQEYDLKRHAIERWIRERLIEKEAKSRDIQPNELKRLMAEDINVKARAAAASDPRLSGDMPMSVDLELAELESADPALQQRGRSILGEYLREENWRSMSRLREKYGVRLYLTPPRVAVTAGDGPSLGPADATVTVVVFLDYQCPPCGEAAEAVRRLHDRFPKDVRIVVRDYPSPAHAQASKASEAAACAGEQGRFWQMHDHLFANRAKLEPADLKRYAKDLGLDAARFSECLDASRQAQKWQKDREAGASLGVIGTPSAFVNGRRVLRVNYDALWTLVREELDVLAVPAN